MNVKEEMEQQKPEEIVKQEFVEIKEEPPEPVEIIEDHEIDFEFKVTEDDYFAIVKELRAKDDDLIELEATLVKCPEPGCTKVFKAKKYLYRHRKKKHRGEGEELKKPRKVKQEGDEEDNEDDSFAICHKCGLDVRGNLKQHLRNHEKQEKLKDQKSLHRCEICGKTFMRAIYLRKHFLVHTDEKPFECKWCGKRLRQESNLRYHMKRHTGVKEFVCDLCGRECSSKALLEKHSRTHGTNNAFQCNICLRSYRHQSTLSRHSKIHTNILKCHFCYQTFRYDSHLRKHLLEAHQDVDGINQPRPQPVTVKLKKSSTKVEFDSEATFESNTFYAQPTVIVNNVVTYKHPYAN